MGAPSSGVWSVVLSRKDGGSRSTAVLCLDLCPAVSVSAIPIDVALQLALTTVAIKTLGRMSITTSPAGRSRRQRRCRTPRAVEKVEHGFDSLTSTVDGWPLKSEGFSDPRAA